MFGFEGLVNGSVSEQQVPHHPQRRRNGATAGREHPEGVAHGGEDRGFVNGHPRLDPVGQGIHHSLAIGSKGWDVRSVCKPAFGFPPVRVGEMVQGHDGANAATHEVVHHLGIDGQGGFVPCPFGGLQTAPFDGEPVGGHAEVGQQLKIVLPSVPVIACCATCLETFGGLVDRPVVRLMALNLVRRRGRAPVEAFGEVQIVEVDVCPILVRLGVFAPPVRDQGHLEHDERHQSGHQQAFPHGEPLDGSSLCSWVSTQGVPAHARRLLLSVSPDDQTNGWRMATVPLTSWATTSMAAPLGLSAAEMKSKPSGLTWSGR